MDYNTIMNILQILLYLILGGLAVWFKQNEKLKGKAVEYINTAESMYTDITKAGGQRFNWVVDSLYRLIPEPIRLIIPRSMIENIVQGVFDQMKAFAQKTLDDVSSKYAD